MRDGLVGRYVGGSVRRVEDRRLLTGQGRYIDDIQLDDMLHANFLRSPFPHAEIRGIDASRALALRGVVAVYTAADMKRLTIPAMGLLALPGLWDPIFCVLADERVRMVGDPVVMVVAESRAIAEDACELIEVDYEPLTAIARIEHALDPSRPPIWPGAKGNVLYRDSRDYGDVDGAFAWADRVITERFVDHRQSNQPMETRGSIAEIDPVTGAFTFRSATQSAHALRWILGLFLKTPLRDSVRTLARERDRLVRFGRGTTKFLRSRPKLVQSIRSDLGPVMVKQLAAQPMRIVHLTQAGLGLLAKDESTLPRVLAGDIGGAFGTKGQVSREDIAIAAAAIEMRRTIKWIEDRNEHLMNGGQARDEVVEMSVAVRADGEILGFRVDLTLDQGAYPCIPFNAAMFLQVMRIMWPGPYRVPAMRFSSTMVASNKGTYVPYRGPWAVETWVRERMFDIVARELGIGRGEIRLRNMIGREELPRPMLTGPMLDTRMSARSTLERALEVADFDGWEAVQGAARAEGRLLGLGISTFIEAAPGPPGYMNFAVPGFSEVVGGEPAHAVLEEDGTVAIFTQQVPHGQGHETTLAQVAADQLGVAVESVRIRYGDTDVVPFNIMGTAGSRSATMAGGAVTMSARELRRRIAEIGADLLEAAAEDIVIEDGRIHVAGTPSIAIDLQAVAAEAIRRGGSGVSGQAIRVSEGFDGGEGGWSQATHVCTVEIDPDTGFVTIPRYVVVEDCGTIINPAIVDGQIRGGVAQGIGAVLYEKVAYDEDGNFQAGTFMDFLIPTAMEIPDIEIHHLETPSDLDINYRGVGEGGMIAAPAALTNAIEDALSHLGVRITEQHLPPFRILELMGVIEPSS